MPSSARTERTCEPLAEAVLGRHVATCTIRGRGRSSSKLYNEPRPANHHASRAQRFHAVASSWVSRCLRNGGCHRSRGHACFQAASRRPRCLQATLRDSCCGGGACGSECPHFRRFLSSSRLQTEGRGKKIKAESPPRTPCPARSRRRTLPFPRSAAAHVLLHQRRTDSAPGAGARHKTPIRSRDASRYGHYDPPPSPNGAHL